MNFDYFVERANILLTEGGGKPVTIFKFKEINDACKKLREFYKSDINPDENSGPLQNKVFVYMRELIDDYANHEQRMGWNPRKSANIIKQTAVPQINDILVSAKEESPEKFSEVMGVMLDGMNDFQAFKDFVLNWKSESKSKIAKHREKTKEELTSLDPDYIRELSIKMNPYIQEMNKLMFPRILSRSKGGKIASSKDPKILSGEIILDFLSILKLKNSTYNRSIRQENVDYDSSEAPKKWVSRSKLQNNEQEVENKTIDYYLGKISVKEFEASIGTLMTLIEGKLEKGIGQSLEGVVKSFNGIKNHPNAPENLKRLLDLIIQELERRVSSGESKYFGYDADIYEKIINTEELRHDFQVYQTAKEKIKSADLQTLTSRYQDKISKYMSQLEGKYDMYHKTDSKYAPKKSDMSEKNPHADALETAKIILNLTRKELIKTSVGGNPLERERILEKMKKEQDAVNELQAQFDEWERENPKSDETPMEESVMIYMTEQFKKDSKFSKPIEKFEERGFKKFKNYNHWLTYND